MSVMIPEIHSVDPVEATPSTEAVLAAEMAKLSMKERDEVLHDLHGVSDPTQEDEHYVSQCLERLDDAIALIPDHCKQAYYKAKELDPTYLKRRDVVLMFLRSQSFDLNAAAFSMVSHFETKLELFGPEKLCKDIGYEDLSEDDIRFLELGYAQILPARDRAGRTVLVLVPTVCDYELVVKQRAAFVVIMHALKDVETQQSGVVGIIFNVGNKRSPTGRGRRGWEFTVDERREEVWKVAKLLQNIPLKFRGVHFCYNRTDYKVLAFIVMLVWERDTRIRCRVHDGTDVESLYSLRTFGIPSDILPFTATGELKLDQHEDFCRRLKKASEIRDDVHRIVVPRNGDILLGRGKPLQRHTGNMRYHNIIECYHERYENAQKLEKTSLTKEIVQEMKDNGGRFLKQDEIGWVEIDDEAARSKVSHTFRNHRIAAKTRLTKNTTKAQKRSLLEITPPSKDPLVDISEDDLMAVLDAHDDPALRECLASLEKGPPHPVVVPGLDDVLLGRGKPLHKHPGNIRYHKIIEQHHIQYEIAQKQEKTNLSRTIVDQIKSNGGRFLKQGDNGWVEVDDDTARYKVSHTFRNLRIAEKKKGPCEEVRKIFEADWDPSKVSSDFSQAPGMDDGVEHKRRRTVQRSLSSPSLGNAFSHIPLDF